MVDPYFVTTVIGGAAAGFVFGTTVLLGSDPMLFEDGHLRTSAAMAAEKVGSAGVTGVTACLMFGSILFSIGVGLIFASTAMMLLRKVGVTSTWLVDTVVGASTVLGTVATGVLAGVVPVWSYVIAQCIMVVICYMRSNVNETATALLIIFVTLHLSIVFGRMGFIIGLFAMAMTISFIVALRKFLKERWVPPPTAHERSSLLGGISLGLVIVASLGFPMGLAVGGNVEGEPEVVLMLESVLWMGVLFAGLLGAALGTITAVDLGPGGAVRVVFAATVTSFVTLKAVLPACSVLGARSSVGALFGVASAAGISLGASRVALKTELRSTNVTLGSVVIGVLFAIGSKGLQSLLLVPTTTLVAALAFFFGAPRSPFHTQVNLRWGLITGPELIRLIGKETVTMGAAPLGAGALGAAALGTAALGRVGTVGVTVAVLLALGKTLISMVEESTKPKK